MPCRNAALGFACGAVLLSLPWAAAVQAGDAMQADLSCARRSDPGRVGCELSVRSNREHYRLYWVDGLVVEVPSFLKPLRARITKELPSEGKASATVPLAFWASQLGAGFTRIEVRGVLCPVDEVESKRCTPVVLHISKQIRVG